MLLSQTGGPTMVTQAPSSAGLDLLSSGLDSILGGDISSSQPAVSQTTTGLLGDIFGFTSGTTSYVAPKTNWLPAEKGKGFDLWGTFSRK